MHDQSAEQRVDPGKGRTARLTQSLDQAVDIARIGDEPVLGADRVIGDEVQHQREDVIKRQRGDHHILARTNAPPRNALNCSVLATRLRCDSAAPLESPVVPPVYCRNNRSSPASDTGLKSSSAPAASILENATAFVSLGSNAELGSSASMPSLGLTLMICLTPVLPMISASVPETPLKMTMVSTLASLSWCSSSRGV